MDLQTAAQIGQLLSGLALAGGTLTAIVIFKTVQKRQVQDTWSSEFRKAYAEFWSDEDCTVVRKWILNKHVYEDQVKEVFANRNKCQKEDCDIEFTDHEKLETFDRFCSVLMRAKAFPRYYMSKHEQELWSNFLDHNFWVGRIKKREEMFNYLQTHWDRLL